MLAAAGCRAVGPDYAGPPAVDHGETFSGGRGGTVGGRWWEALGRRELDGLVAEALGANFDIAIAAERLREARAARGRAAAALLPRAGGQLSFTRLDLGGVDAGPLGELAGEGFFGGAVDYWGTGFDVGWELDVFGGGRRGVRAARAREGAAAEALDGARLAVAAEVVGGYCTLAALREQRGRVAAQVALQERQVADTADRVEAGAVSRLELDRARARLEATRAELPGLEAAAAGERRRLALLLGARPGALEGRGVVAAALPEKLPMPRTGVPAELLLRRPDLRAAERELAAAVEEVGVAVAAFYPKFTIGGGPSGFGRSFGDLFDASSFVWQFGPKVEWAPFAGGANRAALDAAGARARAQMLAYEKAVLAAVGEVEDALDGLRAETARLAAVQRALAAQRAAAARLRDLHEAGAADQVEVLVEEERLREVEIAEVRAKAQMVQRWVHLHKALGGGFR